jgi:hypothetical protein
MKREISCTLSGENLVRTYRVLDDDGKLHSENVSVQGDRETVLAQLEAQVVEAKRDRDGMLNPVPSKPAPADGAPGEEVSFWLSGFTLYETRTRRGADGKFQSQQSQPLGPRRQRLENAEERLAEITKERDAAKNAK